jgi:hypothetical protein
MKKVFFFAVFTVFAFTTSLAQDDGVSSIEINYGIKAGVNFSSIAGDDVDDLDGRTSLNVGAVVNIPVSELFAVQPEVVFSTQGATFDVDGIDGTARLDYINIPVLADFTVAEGFSLQGGPQVGFKITSEVEVDGETEELEDVESVDFGLGIGAQYRLPLGLFFQARYVIGLSNINSESDDIKNQNSVFSIGAGWFFN